MSASRAPSWPPDRRAAPLGDDTRGKRLAPRSGRAERSDGPSDGATPEELSAILALVDELAFLAAELWFAGKLDDFPPEEPADVDDA